MLFEQVTPITTRGKQLQNAMQLLTKQLCCSHSSKGKAWQYTYKNKGAEVRVEGTPMTLLKKLERKRNSIQSQISNIRQLHTFEQCTPIQQINSFLKKIRYQRPQTWAPSNFYHTFSVVGIDCTTFSFILFNSTSIVP